MIVIQEYQEAYVNACLLELKSLKPGNVGVHGDGHGMTLQQFIDSAMASSSALFDPTLESVGQRILQAVSDTRRSVGDNTNLGIILLVAPIAHALVINCTHGLEQSTDLQVLTAEVLNQLTIEDAIDAYQAIQTAQPGGMGEVDDHDVSDTPTITLRQAMEISAPYDRIAYQFHTNYKDIFDHNLPVYWQYLEKWQKQHWAATAVFLSQWVREPDTLIIRKKGLLKAKQISDMIAPLTEQVLASDDPQLVEDELLALDRDLKSKAINPGTTADITVASLFVAQLELIRKKGHSTS
jgi:triphosphoribosyl-dephospho-CoA synthase